MVHLDILELGVIIVTTITIVVVICNYIYTTYYTISPDVNWSSEEIKDKNGNIAYLPKEALLYEIKHRGLPTKLDRSYGGDAVWDDIDLRKRGLPYSRIIIRDKIQLIDTPYEHIPFLEYYLRVPRDRVDKNLLMLISASPLYAFSSKTYEVIARSDSSAINQNMLSIITRYIREYITYDQALDELKKIENDIYLIKSDTSRGFSREQELYF